MINNDFYREDDPFLFKRAYELENIDITSVFALLEKQKEFLFLKKIKDESFLIYSNYGYKFNNFLNDVRDYVSKFKNLNSFLWEEEDVDIELIQNIHEEEKRFSKSLVLKNYSSDIIVRIYAVLCIDGNLYISFYFYDADRSSRIYRLNLNDVDIISYFIQNDLDDICLKIYRDFYRSNNYDLVDLL